MTNSAQDNERTFTLAELRRFDGEQGPMYIAYQGIVYDITDCPHWRKGMHEGLHFPGQDLSSELREAPHGEEVFERACLHRVGCLSEPK